MAATSLLLFLSYLCSMPQPFLTAEWRNFLMANYHIDKKILEPYLPCRTELDTLKWNYMKAAAEKQASELIEGSEEEFFTEHYWGHTIINQNCSGTYQVAHPRWGVHKVKKYDINCSTKILYGPQFAECLSQEPSTVFLAAGSPIKVMKGTKIFASKTL